MNGIFGLLTTDGSPVDPGWLAAMSGALDFWARDGAVTWQEGSTSLGCAHQNNIPEFRDERLPSHDPASGLTLTAGARLDNRAELLHLLNISSPSATDSDLILAAYRKWGEDCVHHLDGDWHFAIWDAHKRQFFLARDQHGNTGLYYFSGPRFFAFASSKKALLALDAIPKKPDLLRLAQVLTAWPGDGTLSGYEGIFRLPPAHRMTVSGRGVRVERYWSPEAIPELRLPSPDDYVEAFLEIFSGAVKARLRSQYPIGVTLSSGLDSGAVSAVAAEQLKPRGQSLLAFTSVPLTDPTGLIPHFRYGDETRLSQVTARHLGLEHILIPAADVSPLDGLRHALDVHDEPVHSGGNQFWIAALLEAARQRGISTLLTGQMGNATISWSGATPNIWDPLRRGDLLRVRSVYRNGRQAAGYGHWRAVRRFLLRPLLFSAQHAVSRSHPWQAFSPIRVDFANRMDIPRRLAADDHRPEALPFMPPLEQRLRIIQPGRNVLGSLWLETGAFFGMDARDPTKDRRVIEFGLSVPDAIFRQNGLDRWLVRRSMEAYLPDEVRLNTRRGLQAADIGRRVLDDESRIREALQQLKQHDLARNVLDIPRMEGVLASLHRGLTPTTTDETRNILLRGLLAGLFLLRF